MPRISPEARSAEMLAAITSAMMATPGVYWERLSAEAFLAALEDAGYMVVSRREYEDMADFRKVESPPSEEPIVERDPGFYT